MTKRMENPPAEEAVADAQEAAIINILPTCFQVGFLYNKFLQLVITKYSSMYDF